eukprot:g14118.t1
MYFRNIIELLQCSPTSAHEIVQEALRESFHEFQFWSAGPVRQCIHAPANQSVEWMHLHTFCSAGHLDRMPGGGSWCGRMWSAEEGQGLAEEMLSWAKVLDTPPRSLHLRT